MNNDRNVEINLTLNPVDQNLTDVKRVNKTHENNRTVKFSAISGKPEECVSLYYSSLSRWIWAY